MPLSIAAREQVKLFCATLENLAGSSAKAQADLRSILWKTPLLEVEADILDGVIANNRSEFADAQQLFQRAQDKAEALVEARLAHIHKGLGWMHWREQNLEQAWREVSIARYEVENLEGRIQFSRYAYDDAIERFEKALATARELNHDDGAAKTCNNLMNLYVLLGQFETAQHYYQEAEVIYRRIGNAIAIDGMAINYAVLQNLAGNHRHAADLLEQTLVQKQRIAESLTTNIAALIYQGLAEAFLGLRDLDTAQGYVQQAIDQEESSILPDSYRTQGEILLQRGQLELAENRIRQSIAFIEQYETPDVYLGGYAWRALAQVYVAQKNLEAAQEAKATALEMFTQINLPNEVAKTHEQLKNL
jgi:tetratricopeptide (TPR) repeat protein